MVEAIKEESRFRYFMTGELIMDYHLNATNSSKAPYIEYIAFDNNPKSSIIDAMSNLYSEAKKKSITKRLRLDYNNNLVRGYFDNNSFFSGKKAIIRLATISKIQATNIQDYIYTKDIANTNILREIHGNNNGFIDYAGGVRPCRLKTIKTIKDPELIYDKNPLKLFYIFYLGASRGMIFDKKLANYISETDYFKLFENVDRNEIKRLLKIIIVEDPIYFKNMLKEFTNLTKYLYTIKRDLC